MTVISVPQTAIQGRLVHGLRERMDICVLCSATDIVTAAFTWALWERDVGGDRESNLLSESLRSSHEFETYKWVKKPKDSFTKDKCVEQVDFGIERRVMLSVNNRKFVFV